MLPACICRFYNSQLLVMWKHFDSVSVTTVTSSVGHASNMAGQIGEVSTCNKIKVKYENYHSIPVSLRKKFWLEARPRWYIDKVMGKQLSVFPNPFLVLRVVIKISMPHAREAAKSNSICGKSTLICLKKSLWIFIETITREIFIFHSLQYFSQKY